MGHKSGQRVRIGADIEAEMAEVQQNAVVAYARDHELEAMKFLRRTMKSRKTPESVRLKAAENILDRSRGKPVQPIDQRGLGAPKIQVIINKLSLGGGPEPINVTPDPKVIDAPAVEIEVVRSTSRVSTAGDALFGV